MCTVLGIIKVQFFYLLLSTVILLSIHSAMSTKHLWWACGKILLLLNISVRLLLNTKEVVRPVSAAIQKQNSLSCFKNLATCLFFFSNLFRNLANARCRLSLSSISKPDWFLAGSPLYNSTFKFRNRDFPLIF